MVVSRVGMVVENAPRVGKNRYLKKKTSGLTSLSIGDNAKVGRQRSVSRYLYVYLRLYAYVNVFIRINTLIVTDYQRLMIFGSCEMFFRNMYLTEENLWPIY